MKFLPVIFALLTINIQLFSQTPNLKETPAKDWHHLDPSQENVAGIATKKAYKLIDSLKKQPQKIVVAIIDGDLDVNHEDLKHQIWQNPSPSHKGYQGDINGWNFLGTSNGLTITKVGSEAFREYKRLRPTYEGKTDHDFKSKRKKKELAYFLAVKKDAKIGSYVNFGKYAELTWQAFLITDSLVKADLKTAAPIKVKEVMSMTVHDSATNDYYQAAVGTLYKYKEDEDWTNVVAHQRGEYDLVMQRIESLKDQSNPRDSIQDNVNSLRDRFYGNGELFDSTSYHGTFVAGLIGASRNNGIGLDGITNEVEIMGIRAVPDGDEFDKDIALAIRYAVDHGARIINMSFGKYYSPQSKWVEKAMRYAMRKNVLLVHAAGNDKKNIDEERNYPSLPAGKNRAKNSLIRVGASTSSGTPANFTNYGKEQVDLFAPGFQIYSTKINNEYTVANGTSFSAPIVAGVAALVLNYYPDLTAVQLKQILMESAERNKQEALKGLAVNEGIVNAYDALRIAGERYGE